MDRTEIIVEKVKKLIEKYGNDEETKKEFCEKVRKSLLSGGEFCYNPEVIMWREEMPKIRSEYVKVFCDDNNSLILEVTGTNDGLLNTFYTIITTKVAEELSNTPEITATSIDIGDGDEGCIYFTFEGEEDRKLRINADSEEYSKMLLRAEKENKEENIIRARKRRKGFEKLCDSLFYMTDEELKELIKKKGLELENPDLTDEEEAKIWGELSRIAEEYMIPNRTVKTNKKDKWFENYGFLISYGVGDEIMPIGDIVTYKQLELNNGLTDIPKYKDSSDEEKKKIIKAVFSNKKGDLKLKIPVGSLMDLRVILEEYAAQELQLNLSLDDMSATIESIDINGESTRTILGTNYSIYPLDMNKDKEEIKESKKNRDDDELEK